MRLADKIATMARRGAPLPYLRRVAYLESDGNQFLKMFTPSVVDNIFITFMSIAYIRYESYFGKYYDYLYRYSSIILYYGNKSVDTNFVDNKKYTLGPFKITESEHIPLFIFGSADEESQDSRVGYLSKSRIFNMSSNQFNLIPVLDLSGRPAMYDEVSGQLFYNASGTGEFTWGELDAASAPVSSRGGGGTKCLTPRRSYRRLARPSARFCAHSQEWEVAA